MGTSTNRELLSEAIRAQAGRQHLEALKSVKAFRMPASDTLNSNALIALAEFLDALSEEDPLGLRIDSLPDIGYGLGMTAVLGEESEHRLSRVGLHRARSGRGSYSESDALRDLESLVVDMEIEVVERLVCHLADLVMKAENDGPSALAIYADGLGDSLARLAELVSGSRGWRLSLRTTTALKEQVSEWEAEGVHYARGCGASWAEIAACLGVTAQSAHSRFARVVPEESSVPSATITIADPDRTREPAGPLS